jgi:hypothetical protein
VGAARDVTSIAGQARGVTRPAQASARKDAGLPAFAEGRRSRSRSICPPRTSAPLLHVDHAGDLRELVDVEVHAGDRREQAEHPHVLADSTRRGGTPEAAAVATKSVREPSCSRAAAASVSRPRRSTLDEVTDCVHRRLILGTERATQCMGEKLASAMSAQAGERDGQRLVHAGVGLRREAEPVLRRVVLDVLDVGLRQVDVVE